MRRDSGFTLIEILIVLAIISTLMAGVMIVIPIVKEKQRETATSNLIAEISGLLSRVHNPNNLGEYPPTDTSELMLGRQKIGKEIGTPNDINVGGETMALVLFMAKMDLGSRIGTEHLANNDEDHVGAEGVTIHTKTDMFEINDAFGNPLIYIHHRDYKRVEEGGVLYRFLKGDTSVRPWKDPKTGTFFKLESFQIISAGPDGIPNTTDDIANFVVPEE
jgi:prepilin-type N-terminal cleavage/methylation domain-containing protein